jgi:CubicO group peptidase (beta-lactamase class C family)
MAPSITPTIATALKSHIDNATLGDDPTLPGAIVHVVDSRNNILFSHGSSSSRSLSKNTLSPIHSVSKLVGAIAFLQLVDRGLASLDDPQIIPTRLPELAAQKVLLGHEVLEDGTKKWLFEDRKGDITPRMLLNHTWGGGYTWFNAELWEYLRDRHGWDEMHEATDPYGTLLGSTLLYQPGTKTNYGQGLEWLGVLVERITRQRLETYLQENIFKPLGLKEMGFMPHIGGDVLHRPENKGKFWPQVLRTPDGLVPMNPDEPERIVRDDAFPLGDYHTGTIGGGLAVSAEDHAHLLTIFLPPNNGVDPVTGHRVLSASSVAEISTPCLPLHIRNNSRKVPTSGMMPINFPAALDAPHVDPEGSYGLACAVQGADRVLKSGARGRSKGTVYWYGLANAEFWIDQEKGIIVFLNGNYLPWNEERWLDFEAGVEEMVYAGLE